MINENLITDPYFDTDRCVERLYAEYLRHPRLIIALDFDSTCFDYHKRGELYIRTIDLIKECKQLEFYIVIFTCSPDERHPFIREYMHSVGVEVDAINSNPIPLPYGEEGKIFYNIFLDDRSGLGQAYTILRRVVNTIFKNRQTATNT